MKKKQATALLLSLVLLFSLLPMAAFAIGSGEVSYNTGSGEVSLDEADYEADGSYLIELEENAYFPYEVQFTYEGHSTPVWFVNDTDSVTVASHVFRVHSEQTNPAALVGMKLLISGEEITVFPQKKAFTDSEVQCADDPGEMAELQSLLPLETKYLTVDLTRFMAAELESVKLVPVLAELDPELKPAVYAQPDWVDSLHTADHFQLIDENTVVNLSRSTSMTLICGTPDQLNPDNLRYSLYFEKNYQKDSERFQSYVDFYAATDAHDALRIYETRFKQISQPGKEARNYLRMMVDGAAAAGKAVYLDVAVREMLGESDLTVSAYQGYLTKAEELDESANISEQLINQKNFPAEGGLLSNYPLLETGEEMTAVTFVLRRGEEIAFIFPVFLEVRQLTRQIVYTFDQDYKDDWTFRMDDEDGSWLQTTENADVHAFQFKSGTRTDLGKMLNLAFFDPDYYYGITEDTPVPVPNTDQVFETPEPNYGYDYGFNQIDVAVWGNYATADRARSQKENVAAALFGNNGLSVDFSSAPMFTIVDKSGNLYHFGVSTEDEFVAQFRPMLYYEDSPGVRRSITQRTTVIKAERDDDSAVPGSEQELDTVMYSLPPELSLDRTYFLTLNLTNWESISGSRIVNAYAGFYQEGKVPENAVNIAGQLFSSGMTVGGYPVSLDDAKTFTLIDTNGTYYWYRLQVRSSWSFAFEFSGKDISGRANRHPAVGQEYTVEDEQNEETGIVTHRLNLGLGYPANGKYYLSLDVSGIQHEGIQSKDLIRKAVVGYYLNERSIPYSAEDIKDRLFTSLYYNENKDEKDQKPPEECGYQADFSRGLTFTIVDIYGELHYFSIVTEGFEWDGSFNGSLTHKKVSGERESGIATVSRQYSNDYQMLVDVYTLQNDSPLSANDEFYLGLNLNGVSAGYSMVQKAVEGFYSSAEEIPDDEPNIAGRLFSNPSMNSGGYAFSNREDQTIAFTIVDTLGEVHWYLLRVENAQKPQNPKSGDTYFRMQSVFQLDESGNPIAYGEDGSRIVAYSMPYSEDSYYAFGYQTLFLMKATWDSELQKTVYHPVTNEKLIPAFETGSANIYLGHEVTEGNRQSGSPQKSGESILSMVSASGESLYGTAFQYSAAAENGIHLKNYWVTFETQHTGGAHLFVNGTNDKSNWDKDTNLPVREIYLNQRFMPYHDIFFANTGDAVMDNIFVTLEDAKGLELDPYWTVGADSEYASLQPMTDVLDGKFQNFIGKVRIISTLEDVETTEDVSGTLIIGFKDSEGNVVEEQRILLTGEVIGNLEISTTSMERGVKYVHYSQLVQTNSKYGGDSVSFTLKDLSDEQVQLILTEKWLKQNQSSEQYQTVKTWYDRKMYGANLSYDDLPQSVRDEMEETAPTLALPYGLELRPNGEIYGVPQEAGNYLFSLTAQLKISISGNSLVFGEANAVVFEIPIWPNSDENVWDITDDTAEEIGDTFYNEENPETYAVLDYAPEGSDTPILPRGSVEHIKEYRDYQIHSAGEFERFVNNVYLDGRRLEEDEYFFNSGSLQVVLLEVTLANAGEGEHTVTLEFRHEGSSSTYSKMFRTSQNYISDVPKTNPVNPTPVNPRPANPRPVTPRPVNPTPVTPAPVNPTPVEPDPNDSEPQQPDQTRIFDDVAPDAWYEEEVLWVYEHKLMIGVSDRLFAPNGRINAAILLSVLARMDKVDLNLYATESVEGLDDNLWYANAIKWALHFDLIEKGDYKAPINRAATAVILDKYLENRGISLEQPTPVVQFGDADDMSDLQNHAFQGLFKAGIFKGIGNNYMDPLSYTTRVQLAVLIHRLHDYVAKK